MANVKFTTESEENFLKGVEDILNIAMTITQELALLALLQTLKEDATD